MSYSALAEIITGITGDGIRKAITRNSLSFFSVNFICEKLHWDRDWVLKGEENLNIVSEPLEHNYKKSLFKPISYYNLNVSAGSVVFLDNGLIENHKPDDYLFIPNNIDADIALPTYGHSMYPEISNGDKVAYKFIKDWSFFNYGMKYLITTDEQRMVKYLKKSTIIGNVLLTSRNSDYQDIEMPIDTIRAILQVRYILKIEM